MSLTCAFTKKTCEGVENGGVRFLRRADFVRLRGRQGQAMRGCENRNFFPHGLPADGTANGNKIEHGEGTACPIFFDC